MDGHAAANAVPDSDEAFVTQLIQQDANAGGFIGHEARRERGVAWTGAAEAQAVIGDHAAAARLGQSGRPVSPELHTTQRIMQEQQAAHVLRASRPPFADEDLAAAAGKAVLVDKRASG